jgi:simple sugar transport system ATP-binding protein
MIRMAQSGPVLQMTGISKEFPAVQALSDVDFRLFPGEIHALLGENGAGKSTLIKVLTGVYSLDAGTIELDGAVVRISGPHHAQQLGISTVYQEVNLCPNLSVAENLFLGRERATGGLLRWRTMRREAATLMADLGLEIDVAAQLGSYPIAVQALVAIARAVSPASGVPVRVLILDEPTSSLDHDEVQVLFGLIRRLRAAGVAILFVSHFLEQIYEVCDRMTVLRNGRLVGERPVAEVGRVELVRMMLGREMEELAELEEERAAGELGPTVLRAEGLGRKGGIAPFDLELRAGEVVGLAGLLGSGRTELARLLYGADHADSGRLHIGGDAVSLRGPHTAIARGVAFCPENRKTEGLVPDLTVRENIILAMQAARGWTRPIPRETADELVRRYIAAFDIRPAAPEAKAGSLSGGNQQKVLLARWLIASPRVLILDEPTRGIDVGAKAEIQKLVSSLTDDGMAVLFISAELEEVLRLSHSIGVLRDRTLVARLDNGPEVDEERIMETIASGAQA